MVIKENDLVKWKWGQGEATGKVQSIFHEKITRVIDGSEVTRNGSKEDPALYIAVKDGNNVLKLASEVAKVG